MRGPHRRGEENDPHPDELVKARQLMQDFLATSSPGLDEEDVAWMMVQMAETVSLDELAEIGEKACLLYPTSWRIFKTYTAVLYFRHCYEESLEMIDRIEDRWPGEEDTLAFRIQVLTENGFQDEEVKRVATEWGIRYGDHGFAWFMMGRYYHGTLRPQQAFPFFKEALTIYRGEMLEEMLDEALTCAQHLRKEQELLKLMEELTDQQADDALLWYAMAFLHNGAQQFAKAEQAISYALALDPESIEAHALYGDICMNRGEYALATKAYRRYLKALEEPHPDAYCHLAASYEKQELYAKAMAYYKKALALESRYPDALFGVGSCLMGLGRWMEAVHFLKKAVDIEDGDSRFWLTLAKAERELGNELAACQAYSEATHLEPQAPEAWLEWSYIFYEQGDLNRAIELIEEGLEELPDSADMLYRAVAYYIANAELSKAVRHLEMALLLDYPAHTQLYDFFSDLSVQKSIYRLISQFKN